MNQNQISSLLITQIGKGFSMIEFPGKWRMVNALGKVFSKACPEVYCYPHTKGRVAVRLTDRIGRLMWAGCYEQELMTIMKCLLDPGMTFIDIGANIGFFTVLAASLVGEKGEVHSFEPDPDCFERLRSNTLNYKWIWVYPIAISDTVGEINFNKSPRDDESGWGTILAEEESRSTIRVSALSLDHWLSAKNVRRIDFIKVDVEGAEPRVLLGARMTIEKYRPVLFMEVNEVCLARGGKSSDDIQSFFKNAEYSIQGLFDLKTRTLQAFLAVPKERFDLINERVTKLPMYRISLKRKL